MKRILVFIAAFVIAHLLTVVVYPYTVVIYSAVSAKDVKVNEIYHQAPINASFRKVVMPSPDILYSACRYDLRNADLLIKAKIPDTYWSVSFYAMNTDNYYTINDTVVRKMGKEEVTILLTRKNVSIKADFVVRSPSDVGILIFRIFVPSKDMLPLLIEVQRSASCQELTF